MMTKTIGCLFAIMLAAGCEGASSDAASSSAQSALRNSAAAGGALRCCPTNFDLYSCQQPDGGMGLACHNPALGCASSLTCGQGCDPEVSGRCECVENVLCIRGDHFDHTLCKCVPDVPTSTFCSQDSDCPAGEVCAGRSPIVCPPNAFCVPARICVPAPVDAGAPACTTAADCHGALPALCELCPDGNPACAHFVCVAGACDVAICPRG